MPPKHDVDPEEVLRQKFRAKCRFRALGRLVLENLYWLIEGVDEYTGTDVKRRVEQAVRTKPKKQLLTINDKALLNKLAQDRTHQEQVYLYRILGDLKCFKRYPNCLERLRDAFDFPGIPSSGPDLMIMESPQEYTKKDTTNGLNNVKRRLAAATYFKYYCPNRVIIRQNHVAEAMYFIVTGKVTISNMVFDEFLQQEVSVDITTLSAGDVFGEVALLHDIKRAATVTTNSHCELLTLLKEDFKYVLRTLMQKQWDEVKLAMSAFTYFDRLDEISRRDGCIVAKMKSYKPNDTLLGDGEGVPNYVYFVLTGRCQMIESLQVFVTTRLGREFYSLYDPYTPEEESEHDFDKKFESLKVKSAKGVMLNEVQSAEDISQPTTISHGVLKSSLSTRMDPSRDDARFSVSLVDPKRAHISNESARLLLRPSESSKRQSFRMSASLDTPSTSKRKTAKKENVLRTYLMQVVIYNPGSTFGFGENMRDRRIVALTPVNCLLLPKVWLLQHNSANIWSRIQHFLEKSIPTKKQLFKEFVSARRWKEFRDGMVADAVAHTHTVNFTSIHDVPYSIRMEEMTDI